MVCLHIGVWNKILAQFAPTLLIHIHLLSICDGDAVLTTKVSRPIPLPYFIYMAISIGFAATPIMFWVFMPPLFFVLRTTTFTHALEAKGLIGRMLAELIECFYLFTPIAFPKPYRIQG